MEAEGNIHISGDVIGELARKTIQGIPHIRAANARGAFGLGRRGESVRVAVENGEISVDAYVLVRYGQRIPDLAWDVQEKVKANLERYTGYRVKMVNINVQGIYLDEPQFEFGGEESVFPVETDAARNDSRLA